MRHVRLFCRDRRIGREGAGRAFGTVVTFEAVERGVSIMTSADSPSTTARRSRNCGRGHGGAKPVESRSIVPAERIARRILIVRGHRVMLDADLAILYGVSTRRLNEQVRRNRERFPEDFAFVLTRIENANLMSQIATSSQGWGGRRKLPYVFTEHGAVMLASVLNSPVAVRASVQVVRAFVRLREMLATHRDLAQRVETLERNVQVVFDALRELQAPPPRGETQGADRIPSETVAKNFSCID